MKLAISVETDIDTSTETENLRENIPRRKSDHKMETSTSVSITSEAVDRQIRAVIDPPSQQLAHLCELMRELKNEQSNRRYKQTASSRVASSSSGSGSWSDNVFKTNHLLRRSPLHLLVSFHTLR